MSDDFHLFGKPGQPEHTDFFTLSNIVLQLDGHTENPDFDFEDFLASIVDPESITYVAQQRVLRMVDQMGLPRQLLPAIAAVWLDAFMIGFQWADNDH